MTVEEAMGDYVDCCLAAIELEVDGTILRANDNYLRLCGYGAEELAGQPYSLLCPADQQSARDYVTLRQAWQRGERLGGLYCRRGRSGRIFWLEFAYNPVFGDDGRPVGIVGIGLDVTDRTEAVTEQCEIHQAVHQSMLMAEYTPDGRLAMANDLMLEVFHYRREEVLGCHRSLFHPEEEARNPRFRQQWDYVCSGNIYSGQMECRAAGGRPVWIEGVFAPIYGPGGVLVKIALFALNATWRVFQERRDLALIRRLARVCESTRTAVVLVDRDTRALYINDSFTRMFGYARDEFLGGSAARIFGPAEQEVAARVRARLSEDRALHLEEVAYAKDGRRLWVACAISLAHDEEDDANLFLVAVLTDITDVKMNERLQNKALEAMVRDLPTTEILALICREVELILPEVKVAVIGVDEKNHFQPLGQAGLPPACVRALTGLPVEREFSVSGRALIEGRPMALHQDDLRKYPDPDLREAFDSAGLTSGWAVPIVSVDNEAYGVVTFYSRGRVKIDGVQERLGQIVSRLCAVALERENTRRSMRRLAFYDELTGLPNRGFLITLAERLLKSARRAGHSLAVIVVSLDRIMFLSESLGHQQSEEVLRRVAVALHERWPQAKDVVGRLSGGDLAVILSGCDPIEAVAEIQALASRPVVIGDLTLSPTASLGISMYPTNGADVETLLHHATLAMGQARAGGFGRFCFFIPEQDEQVRAALAMESALRRALGGPELDLAYQPQVCLSTGRLTGVEALIRWTSPIFGYVAPERFIPLIESSGLIGGISDWILAEACGQLSRWRRQGLAVPSVSVNLAATNFNDPEIVDRILALVRREGLEARDLVLELTERVFMDSGSTALAVIDRAWRAGLRLSVDDFGTGYSCLSYLHRLPISELKLDRSFVLELEETETSRRISQAIMGIGQSLGLHLVAEGVETERQLELLRGQGWHSAQGFHFARPMSAGDFADWLSRYAGETLFTMFPANGEREAARPGARLPLLTP